MQTNGNLENGRGSKLFHRSRTFARDRFFTKTTFSKPTNRKEALGITRKRCTSLRLNLLKREWRRSKKSRNYNRAVRASPASSLAQSNYCVIWCLNTGAKRPIAVAPAESSSKRRRSKSPRGDNTPRSGDNIENSVEVVACISTCNGNPLICRDSVSQLCRSSCSCWPIIRRTLSRFQR